MRNIRLFMAAIAMTLCFGSCINLDYDYYTPGSADLYVDINRMDIDWPYGTVQVRYHNKSFVSFYEDGGLQEEMCYYLTGGSLYLRYSNKLSVKSGSAPKNLVVYIPSNTLLDELEVDTNSANVDIDADSYDVEISTRTGDIYYSTGIVADEIEINTSKGNVALELPSRGSFFLDFDTISGRLVHSDFMLEGREGSWWYGNGQSADIDVETTSGNLELYYFKGVNPARRQVERF